LKVENLQRGTLSCVRNTKTKIFLEQDADELRHVPRHLLLGHDGFDAPWSQLAVTVADMESSVE
jgi:hypothetical protein